MAASIGQRLVLLFVINHIGRIVFFWGDYFTRTQIYYNPSMPSLNWVITS